jgi:two-component system cell cycle sensor histidine kinase PleC
MVRADPQRGLLILTAVFLAILGVAVPHLANESLSSLLFLAGAGLVAFLLWSPPPHQSTAPQRVTAHDGPAVPHRSRMEATAQKSFTELIMRPAASRTLEREQWARLTAQMSHELRTPLNAVLGFSELMSSEAFGPLGSSCYTAYARDIHASGRMLLKSADDALAITKVLTSPERNASPQTCCLKAAIEDACAFARQDMHTHSLSVTSGIESTDVIGDRQATRQMLINLIAAAAGDTRDGALLAITTECKAGTVHFSISAEADSLNASTHEDGFPMILARTLCELSGARLACNDTADGGRRWSVNFIAAAQNDLFLTADQA